MIRIVFSILLFLFQSVAIAEQIDVNLLGPMEGDIVIGDPDSKNTIIEYSSLTCPSCAYFHANIFPEIDRKYLQTKKAKMIFRHFAIKQHDLKAGALSVCVPKKEQKIFLDVLFKTQRNWGFEVSDPSEALEYLARLGGLDGKTARKCLEDKSIEKAILNIRENAQNKMKINATPTFIINGKKFQGAIGIDIIEKELS